MRILWLETQPGAGAEDARLLTEAGHDVVRCHDEPGQAFPCAALTSTCPMDASGRVDVVLDARAGSVHEAPPDMGAVCAFRRGIPVLVSGCDHNPYPGWATTREQGEPLTDAAARAIADGLERRAAPLRDEARRLLEQAGVSADAVDVVVRPAGQAARITIQLPDGVSDDLANHIATRVHAVDKARPSPESILDVGVRVGVPASA